MDLNKQSYIKIIVVLIVIIFGLYYLSFQTQHRGLQRTFQIFYETINNTKLLDTFLPASTVSVSQSTSTVSINAVSGLESTPPKVILTSTTNPPTTLDPAELISERPPIASAPNTPSSNGQIAVFLFHTQHDVLMNLQLYLIKKMAVNLTAIEVFVDGTVTESVKRVTDSHKALLHAFPVERHGGKMGPSDRNTAVVNWGISTRAKTYLSKGVAILLLDGDVLPLSPFDSITLLNSRDMVCRKHPALFARFCWIGFICLSPKLLNTIDNFNVSQDMRNGKAYDSGGKTAEYLLKYENTSFSWMRETVLLQTDKNLFWGAFDVDIRWISRSFSRCDKCGPEILLSPFNSSNAVFYHMISATSDWRFGYQGDRHQSLYDSIMQSPYGPNGKYAIDDVINSVKRVQQMELLPYFGNLTCEKVCHG